MSAAADVDEDAAATGGVGGLGEAATGCGGVATAALAVAIGATLAAAARDDGDSSA
jgi:hypothetical protein